MANLVFVHLPRTGGTSMGSYLLKCGVPVVNIVHNAASGECSLGCCWSLYNPARRIPKDPFFFGFVRNPWEWYVSRYFYFLRRSRQVPERGASRACDAGIRDTPPISFADHLLSNKENEWFWMTHRYRHLFCDKEGRLLLNFVGRLESVDSDIDVVFEKNGLKPTKTYAEWDESNRQHRNMSSHEHFSYYYNDELSLLVADKDRTIIETYGYERPRHSYG